MCFYFFRFLCKTIKDFVEVVGKASSSEEEDQDTLSTVPEEQDPDSLSKKCSTLQYKLSLLLNTLEIESEANSLFKTFGNRRRSNTLENLDNIPAMSIQQLSKWHSDSELAGDDHGPSELPSVNKKSTKQKNFIPKDHLWSRANSLKKAMKEIIDHTERGMHSK